MEIFVTKQKRMLADLKSIKKNAQNEKNISERKR